MPSINNSIYNEIKCKLHRISSRCVFRSLRFSLPASSSTVFILQNNRMRMCSNCFSPHMFQLMLSPQNIANGVACK